MALGGLCWPSSAGTERNNWAVLVMTSRYWYNYRHGANVLTFYHTIKRLGIPDSQIILMMAEDIACNPRNNLPGRIFNDQNHRVNLYGESVEVDYRGDEVSVDNFMRLLTGRHPPDTPRNKRLLTDSMSNIFVFITGHSGEEFIKFQDSEEISSTDIANAFAQMHRQKRYQKIFWVSDTCQAATLQNQFYSPNIIAMGSSSKKENSYSHHVDHALGIAVVDRFTYYAMNFLDRLTTSSTESVQNFKDWFQPKLLHSTPALRSDLFQQKPDDVYITEFLASAGKLRYYSSKGPPLLAPRNGSLGEGILVNFPAATSGGSAAAGSCAAAFKAPPLLEGRPRPAAAARPSLLERFRAAIALAVCAAKGGGPPGIGADRRALELAVATVGNLGDAAGDAVTNPAAGILGLAAFGIFVGLASFVL